MAYQYESQQYLYEPTYAAAAPPDNGYYQYQRSIKRNFTPISIQGLTPPPPSPQVTNTFQNVDLEQQQQQYQYQPEQQIEQYQPQPQQQRWINSVYIGFCTGGEETYGHGFSGMLNKFVAWRSGGMYHVETVFGWTDGSLSAWNCTTIGDAKIKLTHRNPVTSYNNQRWTMFNCVFTQAEMEGLWDFFVSQESKPYNLRGLFCNFIWGLSWLGTGEMAGRSWFCSELIMAALKYIRQQEFAPYLSSRTNIRDLYDILRNHKCFSPMISAMGGITSSDLVL